jgi:acyl carrier protein
MPDESTLDQLRTIFEDVFEHANSATFGPDLSAKDVEGWDSVQQVLFTVSVEAHFGIRFKAAEIENLKNIGDFVLLIDQKLSENR